MKAFSFFWALWVLLILSPPAGGRAAASTRALPFQTGERLTYVLKWEAIPAGEAVLEILPPVNVAGAQCFHFTLKASTNAFVDLFYKVRDCVDAFADCDLQASRLFLKQQKEGPTQRNVRVEFDWGSRQATYSNFGRMRPAVALLPGTLDPLSALYFCRSQDPARSERILRPVTDGKKCVIGRARILGRRSISTPCGTYDAYLLEPDLAHVGGVFKKSPGAKIKVWISADQRRLPVRVESRVLIGRFIAELVLVEKTVAPKAGAGGSAKLGRSP